MARFVPRSYNSLTSFWGFNLLVSTHEAPILRDRSLSMRLQPQDSFLRYQLQGIVPYPWGYNPKTRFWGSKPLVSTYEAPTPRASFLTCRLQPHDLFLMPGATTHWTYTCFTHTCFTHWGSNPKDSFRTWLRYANTLTLCVLNVNVMSHATHHNLCFS
jgi:hypothetical protein